MTKEEIFEELLAKRSATPDNAGPVWHETGGLDVEQLKIVSWSVAIVLSILGISGLLASLLCICYCIKSKNNKKKQHAFGIKKSYFKDRVCKPRNPTPVSNPSKGHYLKKSPSPTGHKSPPGIAPNNSTTLNNGASSVIVTTSDEYSQRKPLLAQQTGEFGDGVDSGGDVILRRSSFEPIVDADSNQVLGTLHATIRYGFDKNALGKIV